MSSVFCARARGQRFCADFQSLPRTHKIIVGFAAARVNANVLIALGCLGTALAPMLFAIQGAEDPYWQWQFPAMIL